MIDYSGFVLHPQRSSTMIYHPRYTKIPMILAIVGLEMENTRLELRRARGGDRLCAPAGGCAALDENGWVDRPS